jgi:ankyrin repeat protein
MNRHRLGRGARQRPIPSIVLAAAMAIATSVTAAACGDSAGGEQAEPDATLADAVVAGDHELARSIVESGADPDEPRRSGLTPLMRAAARDDAAMVEILLDGGADLEATDPGGLTPAHVAAQANAAATLEVLVEAGADVTITSKSGMGTLHHAAELGSVEVIERLDALGIDLDTRSEAITQGHGYPRDTGPTALSIAVRAGQIEAVEALLSLGADVEAMSGAGHTPLLVAVFTDQPPELVSMLLDAGADPGVEVSCELGCSAESGDALAWAVELDRSELVPLLSESEGE